MLKPDPNDPNYKDQMKLYEKDPSGWGPGGAMPIPMPASKAKAEDKPAKAEK